MALELRKRVFELLTSKPDTRFKARDIANWICETYPQEADTLHELRILYGMHGIGLIKLDRENPAESEILIPARERTEVEWAMCSRLANENPDFRAFVKKVRQFFQTGDL